MAKVREGKGISGEQQPGEFKVSAYRCRCGHEWLPKSLSSQERPRVCPKCKSPNWDRPYKFRRKPDAETVEIG